MSEEAKVSILTDPVSETSCPKCGTVMNVEGIESFTQVQCPNCSAELSIPARLGSFLLEKLLGTGGMGGVFYAKDESLGRAVAIKVMLKSMGDDPEFIESFKREAQAAAKLNHPNIAQIYSFGQEKGQPYIVMELIEGRGFDKIIESEDRVDQSLVMQIGHNIAAGLKEAEEIGLIHGDIKPENILLDKKWHAKLVDFGLASFTNQGQAEGIWGTPYYIAPEKVKGKKPDARADIYSLGATLYHGITGQPPFDGETPVEVVKARLTDPPPPINSIREDVNPDVERIIMRMLAVDPMKRYPNYSSLISDIAKLLKAMAPAKTLQKSKKMKIKKVTKLNRVAASPSASDDLSENTTGTTGQIRIKKRKSTVIPAEKKAGMRKPAPVQKEKSLTGLWILLSVIGLCLITGAVMFFRDRELKARAARLNAYNLKTAIEQSSDTFPLIIDGATNILNITAEVLELKAKTITEIEKILGKELSEIPELNQPCFIVTADPQPEEVSEDNKEEPEKEDVKEKTEEEPEEQVSNDDNENFGSDLRERLEAKKAAERKALEEEKKRSEKKSEPEEKKEDEAPAPEPAAVPAPVIIKDENLQAAVDIFTMTAAVENSLKEAESIAKQASELIITATNTTSTSKAQTDRNQIYAWMNTVTNMEASAKIAIRDITNKLLPLTIKADEIRAQEAYEADQLQKKLEEEERKRKAAAAAAALVQRAKDEVALAATLHEQIRPQIINNSFEQALELVKMRKSEFTTTEGKVAYTNQLMRCTLLVQMKQYIIDSINKQPYRWGWIHKVVVPRADGKKITRKSTVDILSANRDGFEVTAHGFQSWAAADVTQMNKLIRRYITDKQSGTVKERAELNLGAALYYLEQNPEDEQFKNAAQAMVDKALDLCGYMSDDVQRWIPELNN